MGGSGLATLLAAAAAVPVWAGLWLSERRERRRRREKTVEKAPEKVRMGWLEER